MNQLDMARLPNSDAANHTGVERQSRPLKRLLRKRGVFRSIGSQVDPSPHPLYDPQGVNPLEKQHLEVSSYINLKRMFPISRRYILKKMLPWLAGFVLLFGIYWHNFGEIGIADAIRLIQPQFSTNYALDEIILYGSSLLILSVVFAFYTLQRFFFNYRIEGFRLIIQRGILLIEEGSLPLLPIAEVYLRREVLDFILGLYQVHVAVPIDSTRKFACVEGLTHRNATLLIEYLSAQLSRQVVTSATGQDNTTVGQVAHAANAHLGSMSANGGN